MMKAQEFTGGTKRAARPRAPSVRLNLIATIADDQRIAPAGAAGIGMEAVADGDQSALGTAAILFSGDGSFGAAKAGKGQEGIARQTHSRVRLQGRE